MPTRIFGPSKGNRRPTQVAPSKTPTRRPTAQRGGGGNKAAGSVEPTSTTVPVTSVSPAGQVTNYVPPKPGGYSQREAKRLSQESDRELRRERESRRRVQKVRRYVRQRDQELTPKREVKVSKAFLESPFTKEQLHPKEPLLPPKGTPQAKREEARPVTVKGYERSHPTQPKQSVKVSKHQRSLPASTAIISSKGPAKAPPNPKLKGTPEERKEARQNLVKAKKQVRESGPSTGGLSAQEAAILPYVERAHHQYPDIPVSVMMAQIKQESGFNPAAESSAGAFGATQFIPSTAESYGVERGTGPKEIQSQVTGQAHLLHDDNFASDPQGALSSYSGGYAASEYNNPILEDAQANYSQLNHPGNLKAVKNLKAAVKEARELGLKVEGSRLAVGTPSPKLVKKTKAAEVAMKEIEGRPYVWGGGHGSFESWGYDCSGAVSYVIHKVEPHVLTEPLTSGNMGQVLKPGPGALTVFYNSGHTFLRLINSKGEAEYWGTSVGDSGEGGLTRHPAPSASYLAEYNVGHVPGMGKKEALQLGAEPGSLTGGGSGEEALGSFPGMSFSEGGTKAVIEQGAGVKVGGKDGKPGFSPKPIELTPFQKLTKRVKKLQQLGVDVALPGKETKAEAANKPGDSSLHAQLAALEKKYSVGAV